MLIDTYSNCFIYLFVFL